MKRRGDKAVGDGRQEPVDDARGPVGRDDGPDGDTTAERAEKVELEFTFVNNRRPRRRHADSTAGPAQLPEVGSLPRVTRLMALAIKFEGLIEQGVVRDYADLARLGLVSRARITQIMNLLLLAPDIQEALLFLHRVTSGRDPIREQNLRPLTNTSSWNQQRKHWDKLYSGKYSANPNFP